jgi:hypothetical protein
MWPYLLNLWALPPVDAHLDCPAPRAGELPDPFGLYNAAQVTGVWRTVGIASLAATVVLLLACYLLPRASLSPRFVRSWYGWLAATMAFCFAVPFVVSRLTPVAARPGSCTTRPSAFLTHLPFDVVFPRMLAGLVWGLLAFTLFSLIATRLLARGPVAGGFFHYRGCPWPRWNPLEG